MKNQLLTLLLLVLPLAICAQKPLKVKIDGMKFELNTVTKEAELERNPSNPPKGHFVIPEKVTYEGQEYVVTSIGKSAFYGCDVAFVEIPHTIKNIGPGAFFSCKLLSSITIPESVEAIGDNAFRYSKNLTLAYVPKHLESRARELMKHEEIFNYTSIWLDYLRDGATQIVNTNKLLKTYDGITGLKTGTTSKAGACISASAKRDGLSLISVVLGAENTADRFSDAAVLLDYGFANFSSVEPPKPDENPGFITVTKGMCDKAAVKPDISGKFLLKKGMQDSITSEIKLKEDVEAPVKKGTEVGRVTFRNGETVLGEYPIVTLENVERINFSDVFSLIFDSFIAR